MCTSSASSLKHWHAVPLAWHTKCSWYPAILIRSTRHCTEMGHTCPHDPMPVTITADGLVILRFTGANHDITLHLSAENALAMAGELLVACEALEGAQGGAARKPQCPHQPHPKKSSSCARQCSTWTPSHKRGLSGLRLSQVWRSTASNRPMPAPRKHLAREDVLVNHCAPVRRQSRDD